jgi:hypothetical protein
MPIEGDSHSKAPEIIGVCFPGDQNICLANKLNFTLPLQIQPQSSVWDVLWQTV